MDVYDEGLTSDLLGMNPCRISQPVVRVDDVEGLTASDDTCYDGVVVDLLEEVVLVLPRELKAAQVIRRQVGEVRIDMIP